MDPATEAVLLPSFRMLDPRPQWCIHSTYNRRGASIQKWPSSLSKAPGTRLDLIGIFLMLIPLMHCLLPF